MLPPCMKAHAHHLAVETPHGPVVARQCVLCGESDTVLSAGRNLTHRELQRAWRASRKTMRKRV